MRNNWISCKKDLPKKRKKYLVTRKYFTGICNIEVLSFSPNLKKVDEYDFPTEKPGWYDHDSEYGYYECDNVLAWQESPEPYKEDTE